MPTPPRRASAPSSPRTWSRPASTTRRSSPSTTPRPRASRPRAAQICVEGLEHGQRLPRRLPPRPAGRDRRSARSARSCSSIYVQDRAPIGALHRRQLRAAVDRAPRHPGRLRQHGRRRHEALPHRRPLAGAASFRLPVPAPARRLRHRAASPTRSASRSGRASSTSPTSSTRKSPPASRSTRRCPTASPASMC